MDLNEIREKIRKLENLNNSGDLTALQVQKNKREIESLRSRASKITRRLGNLGMGAELDAGRDIPLFKKPRQQQKKQQQRVPIPRKKPLPPIPREKPTSQKQTQAVPEKLNNNNMQYGGPQDPMPLKPDRDRLERSIKSAPEDKNIVEQLVSKLLGRNIRFEDIPDDDPDFDVGYKSEGHFAYPAGRPDLRMGGMTARSAATTKFKKPLGMKGGGAISNAERRRIARIMQDYKQKKARKSNGKRTNR